MFEGYYTALKPLFLIVPLEPGNVKPISLRLTVHFLKIDLELFPVTQIEHVLLIRHGQTDWNVDGRWQGTLPIGLNDTGRTQAQALAAYLAKRQIGSIYSSDLPRALDTALAIGEAVGVTPQTDARLQEFNLGVFQGLTRQQINQQYPNEWREFEADYWNYSVTNGKSRRTLQTRAHDVFQHIVAHAV